MAGKDKDSDQRSVPSSRVGRFARMARMAGGVAGGMLAEGGRQLKAGKRPKAKDLLLTPGNAKRVADQLATMRGAAMKVGQMLSMDTGDFLPPELTDILARLREDAHIMPVEQLHKAMVEAYGEDWESLFYGFDARPLAAASIGQVHKTLSPDGREIVLKVQYPGIRKSIDSDVDNIAGLLRLSNLLPDNIDIQPILDDAKAQLHDEADYLKEAKYLAKFGDLLADDERFVVPELLPELTHTNVLAMTYVPGEPIEAIASAPQKERDRVLTALFELMFVELFELRLSQTDPNFANYLYRPQSGEIVLLDFGATRPIKAAFSNNYRKLIAAASGSDEEKLAKAAEKLGYAMGPAGSEYRELVIRLFDIVLEPLRVPGPYDFAASDIPGRLAEYSEEISQYREFWEVPPTDAIYFHRKLGGMFLLGARMQARVDVHQLIERWVK